MLNHRTLADAPAPVQIATLSGAHWESRPVASSRVLARIDTVQVPPSPVYRSEAFVREYRIDDGAFDAVLAGRDERHRIPVLRLLSRMRLVNSRNQLTHSILGTLSAGQASFLGSGDPAQLEPLKQRDLVADIAERPEGDAPVVDASRVSRVLASGSLLLPDGQEIELRRLCPSPRDVHRELVRDLIRREQARMVAGEIDSPLVDHEIAEVISKRCQVPTSRRAVAFIRKDLGVPNARARARRGCYLTATAGFSSLHRAEVQTLRQEAPRAPGVYEIRLEPPGIEYPTGRCPVIYIGSSRDLRKRLLDQVRGNGRNEPLAKHLAASPTLARWMLVPEGWRQVEREVYRHFVETFGASPACNRMSP